MKVYDSTSEMIGNTPLLRLRGFEKLFGTECRLYAKLESFNPTGSAKDRAALHMIEDAEECGKLTPGSVIIEPTSGNTGIGLASVAAVKGYRAIIVMPDTMSHERIALMKAYGAEVVLTDGSLGMKGSIDEANRLAAELGSSFIPDQFGNASNSKAHYLTTGPEIFSALDGNVDVFIAGIGTGGTLTGTGSFLKEKVPSVEIIGVEPLSSPLLTEGKAGAHKIQGIGANFVPTVLDTDVPDRVIAISDEDAYKYCALCGKTEGILCGISSGAVIAAAEMICAEAKEPKNIVILFPDGGDRYLSVDGLYE